MTLDGQIHCTSSASNMMSLKIMSKSSDCSSLSQYCESKLEPSAQTLVVVSFGAIWNVSYVEESIWCVKSTSKWE